MKLIILMAFIEKELLVGRVQYLEKINSKPGMPSVNGGIITKVVEMIQSDELITFMQVEAVFNYLLEDTNSTPERIENSAAEILDFLV
jgi:hypothetical protein